MPTFGEVSAARLSTCHPYLQKVAQVAIVHFEFCVLCGHRNELEQNEAVRRKRSFKAWPHSMHNQLPSLAVDLAPWRPDGIDWEDRARFGLLAGWILRIDLELENRIVWGGDWERNLRLTKPKRLDDLPHFQLLC